jgi:hypothetical protein
MNHLKLQVTAVALALGCLGSTTAQTRPARCAQPLVLNISMESNHIRYDMNGKVFNGYPLDAIADEMEHCWPDRGLFVIATWDVPLSAMTTPGKLQLEKVRYFVKGRNELLYTEVTYGRSYRSLPVTPDVAPIPEDDGTLHPPTKIPTTKGPQ